MTSRDFCFWLQGFFEVADQDNLTPKQTALIKAHLNLVFIHEIDPSEGDAKMQQKLQAAHDKPSLGKPHPAHLPPSLSSTLFRC